MGEQADRPKQKNERVATRFEGVYQRESWSKRFRGRPDVCYSIDYYDPQTKKRVRKTIGWRSEGFTAEMAANMRRELLGTGKKKAALGELYVAPVQNMLFAEAWEMYKRDWLEAQGKATGRNDTILYQKHLSGLAALPLSGITVYRLNVLVSELARKGLAPQTVRHVVGLVRRIMRKMVVWKFWRGELPFAELDLPPLNNERTRYLTPAEARSLMALLAERSPRMWHMALISMHCGLRFGEIAQLTFGDIDYASQTLHVRQSKSGRARQAVMTTEVINALRALPQGNPGALLFPSRKGGVMRAPSDAFESCVRQLGLNNSGEVDAHGRPVEITDRKLRVVFHSLRHTYASWLALSGEQQLMIADLLGHADLEMSRRYTHLMHNARKATAKAIDAVFNQLDEHGEPPR